MRKHPLLLLFCPAVLAASIQTIASGSNTVSFVYEPGKPTLALTAEGAHQLDLPDADHLAEPGELDLPSKVVRVGVPQAGGVSVSSTVVPGPVFEDVTPGTVARFSYEPDTAWFDAPGTDTRPVVETGPIEQLRGVRFVTITIRPASYDAGSRRLSVAQQVRVQVRFDHTAQTNPRTDPLDNCLRQMLLNGEQAVDWKLDPPGALPNPYARASAWLKIQVDSTALYGISGRELAAAGVPISGLDPAGLALFGVGDHEPCRTYPDSLTPVPILVRGEEDGRLDPNDQVVFYGLGPSRWLKRDSAYRTNLYTRYNVYWLTWGGARGARIRTGLAPDTAGTRVVRTGREVVRLEKDLDCPARSGLLWIWTMFLKSTEGEATSINIPLELSAPTRFRGLRGRFISPDTGNYQLLLRLLVNGRQVGPEYAFGQSLPSAPFEFALDTTLPLAYQRNTLTVEIGGASGKRAYLDFLELEHEKRLSLSSGRLHFFHDDTGTFRFLLTDLPDTPLVLDVTDNHAPRLCPLRLEPGDSATVCLRVPRPAEFAAAVPGSLRSPVSMTMRRPGGLLSGLRQADYWIVVPRSFSSPAQMFARYRTGRIPGVSRARADVALLDDIYDDYSLGMEEPAAIKRFFADKQPAYGLLVGDATCDYRNILGQKIDGVPAYEYGLGLNPDALDRTAAAFDAWYADFEGEGASPDMILGRVTPRTAEAFRRFADKVVTYETGPVGFWNKRFLLLADDEFLGEPGRPDLIRFTHIDQCEAMAVLPDNLLQPVKVYLTEHQFAGTRNKPGANEELMRELNRGGLLFFFFGHGSGFDLTHESVLNISRVPLINNEGRTPFCYFGSCSVGRFEDTQFECIAEEMVRMNGGAIGAVAATKATTSASNGVFARNLLTPLVAMPDSTVGQSFFRAWPTDRLYHLFGDPAVVLRLPRPSSQTLAVAPDTVQPGQRLRASAVVESPRGRYDWVLSGPRRVRFYCSPNPTMGTKFYSLPGLELGRGSGRLEEGTVDFRATVPVWSGFDTVFVPDGYYAPVVRSCRLSASVWSDSIDLSILADTLPFTTVRTASPDSAGPVVSFWTRGQRLQDNARVPSEFDLELVIEDESGVMIAPVPGATPLFFVNDRRGAVDLTDQLVFDENRSTVARYRTEVALAGPTDSLCALVSDNQLNRTATRVVVRPVGSNVLAVDSVLVYPNPVQRDARFTFELNSPATCRVRIYTLAGRLVRDLGDHPGTFGYNEVYWDGRDQDGTHLPNGVYLFTLAARAFDPGREQRVLRRDRLIVWRGR